MTFAQVVDATNARVGRRVIVEHEERGRLVRGTWGVLEQSRVGRPIKDGGPEVYKLAPYAWWFALNPLAVTGAQEEHDGRLLRVQMVNETDFVILTLD
jgi:hypothetical protein